MIFLWLDVQFSWCETNQFGNKTVNALYFLIAIHFNCTNIYTHTQNTIFNLKLIFKNGKTFYLRHFEIVCAYRDEADMVTRNNNKNNNIKINRISIIRTNDTLHRNENLLDKFSIIKVVWINKEMVFHVCTDTNHKKTFSVSSNIHTIHIHLIFRYRLGKTFLHLKDKRCCWLKIKHKKKSFLRKSTKGNVYKRTFCHCNCFKCVWN